MNDRSDSYRPYPARLERQYDPPGHMVNGNPWIYLVPPCVADLLAQWDVPERLKYLEQEKIEPEGIF